MFLCRDLKIERELLRAARWNSKGGTNLFNEANSAYLASMVTRGMPGMAADEKKPVMVGFLQALTRWNSS